MHPYTTTADDRVVIIRWLTVLGVAAGVGIAALPAAFGVSVPAYIFLPSPAVVFAGLFVAYDNLLWRRRIFSVRLSRTPDLSGRWEGDIVVRRQLGRTPREQGNQATDVGPFDLVTDADSLPTHPCVVTIRQTWTKMSVEFATAFSNSQSVIANVALFGEQRGLRYLYSVDSITGSDSDLERHDGFARLRPTDEDWTELSGDFFSDQHYQRYGEYVIQRVGDVTAVPARTERKEFSDATDPVT